MTTPLLLLLACLQASPSARAGELYRRAVERSAERARRELLASLQFEVDHTRFSDPWVITTAHYEVRATVSYTQTKRLADGLEFVHAEMVKLLGDARPPRNVKDKIWVYPTMAEYNQFGVGNGAEHSSLLGSFFSTQNPEKPVATYQCGDELRLARWVTHSAVHQFLELGFGTQREVWVDEGLASYFAIFWGSEFAIQQFEGLKQSRDFVPIERLVRDPIQAYGAKAEERFLELGMLFHFLLNSCDATKNGATGDPTTGPFQEFLRAAVRGQDVSESEFIQTFEEASALLEQDFKSFDFSKQ